MPTNPITEARMAARREVYLILRTRKRHGESITRLTATLMKAEVTAEISPPGSPAYERAVVRVAVCKDKLDWERRKFREFEKEHPLKPNLDALGLRVG